MGAGGCQQHPHDSSSLVGTVPECISITTLLPALYLQEFTACYYSHPFSPVTHPPDSHRNIFNGFIITYPDIPRGWKWMNRWGVESTEGRAWKGQRVPERVDVCRG
jgi:hypothetical protein